MYLFIFCILVAYTCKEKPPTIANGEWKGGNDSVEYKCYAGYTMVGGDTTFVCGSNRKWKGSLPVCVAGKNTNLQVSSLS